VCAALLETVKDERRIQRMELVWHEEETESLALILIVSAKEEVMMLSYDHVDQD